MLFPNNIGFSQIEITSNSPAYINESQSLKTIAVSTGAQRWELSLTTGNLKEGDFRRAWAFLNGLGGKANTFNIAMPLLSKPIGAVTGLVQTFTSHSGGDQEINFTNYFAEIGDFVRFTGHSKLYQIINIAGSSATIYPPLINDVTASETVNVNDALITVRLNSNLSKLKVPSQKIAKLKFKLIEAI